MFTVMILCLMVAVAYFFFVFFFKQKTAYEMRISDWSSDVCSSDLVGRDRGGAVAREAQGRGVEQYGVADQLRQHRQRIYAGIEPPDAAFQDPFLPRMPDAHVLLPRDRDAADRAIGEPGECGLDRGGLARMPGGVEHDIARRRRLGDRLRLADRRRRGLFEHDVEPRGDRFADEVEPAARRRAERDRLHLGHRRGHVGERRERRDAFGRVVARRSGERRGGEGWVSTCRYQGSPYL